MATWADLTIQVFYKLDLPSTTTGDVQAAVQQALHDTLVNISNDIPLKELFVTTSSVNLTNPAETLALSTDFSVTDHQQLFGVGVNPDTTVAANEWEWWEEVSWNSWLRQVNTKGDKRLGKMWALNPDNDTIYFTSVPSSGNTWGVKVHYYKNVAAFGSANTPEFPTQHDQILVNGAATQFPQYFGGDRQVLFEKFSGEYQNGLRRLQNDLRGSTSLTRLTSRVRGSTRGRTNWPSSIF